MDFKAGYLWDITGKDRLKVGVSLDGMNGKLKHWNAEDWKSRFYSTEFRLDYSHDFSKVTLNLGGGLQSQVFNYMPDSEAHTASARAADKQHHTLGDFHIGVSSRDESLPLQFTLQTGLKYLVSNIRWIIQIMHLQVRRRLYTPKEMYGASWIMSNG